MKRRNFDFHKFTTIIMIVVGVGFFLFSLIASRYFWNVEDLDRKNPKTTQLSTSPPVNGASHRWAKEYSEPLDESNHTQHTDGATDWLDSRDPEKDDGSAKLVDLDNEKRDETSDELNVTFDQQTDARRELAEAIAAEAWEQIPMLVEEWQSVIAQREAHNRIYPHDEEWAEVFDGFTHARTRIEHKIIEYAMKYHGVYPEERAIYLPDGKIAQLTEQAGLVFTDRSN